MQTQLKFGLTSLFLVLFSNVILSQWISVATSENRDYLKSALYNDSIFIVGGGLNTMGDLIEIYDPVSHNFGSNKSMSAPRGYVCPIAGDSGLYMAGGFTISSGADSNIGSDVMDIYRNGVLQSITMPRRGMFYEAVKVGSKLYFAGGAVDVGFSSSKTTFVPTDSVYVYDEVSGNWSTLSQTIPRLFISMVTDGNKIYFAGGVNVNNTASDEVNIYDVGSDSWTTESLSSPRILLSSAYLNNKVYFAGGTGDVLVSKTIDIWDGSSWSSDSLMFPRGCMAVTTINDLIVFAGGGRLDPTTFGLSNETEVVETFNTLTGAKNTTQMNWNRSVATAISFNNTVTVTGGWATPNLEYFDFIVGQEEIVPGIHFSVYPNPCQTILKLRGTERIQQVRILDISGKQVFNQIGNISTLNVSLLNEGIYFVEIQYAGKLERHKIVKTN